MAKTTRPYDLKRIVTRSKSCTDNTPSRVWDVHAAANVSRTFDSFKPCVRFFTCQIFAVQRLSRARRLPYTHSWLFVSVNTDTLCSETFNRVTIYHTRHFAVVYVTRVQTRLNNCYESTRRFFFFLPTTRSGTTQTGRVGKRRGIPAPLTTSFSDTRTPRSRTSDSVRNDDDDVCASCRGFFWPT